LTFEKWITLIMEITYILAHLFFFLVGKINMS
jgi:hypothetical protein